MVSKAERRRRSQGRKESGSFVMLPKACLNHPNFTSLSGNAIKLLIDLYSQYNGSNNGDFSCAWSRMKKRGWKSEATLNRSKKELINKKWLITSRQGGKNKCSLFAVTFQPIDECKGKLDVMETVTSPGDWKNNP